MDGIDGLLLVPPDRTQILGRAAWKSRYVTVGKPRLAQNRPRQGSSTFTQGVMSVRTNSVNSKASTNSAASDDYYLSVYKSKEDGEPIQQWPIGYVADCKVQQVTNRKQGPVLPTLIVTITDKERRRRSGRATGFISANKESGTTTLWFRTPPDDHHPSLHDWARFILSRKGANAAVSPVSPVLSTPQSRDNPEQGHRPCSGGRFLQHKISNTTHSTGTRDRPATFSSDSPSLRSKRSDISSPSSNHHSALKSPFGSSDQNYTTVVPLSLTASPSDFRGEFIEGWTSAQGRSSVLGSPTRSGRDSIGFQGSHFSIHDAACPPAPGETILDRAFQLGQIPGAETYIPGQEKLSSIARFDALMREADEKRKRVKSLGQADQPALRSAFDDDDSSDEDDDEDTNTGNQQESDDSGSDSAPESEADDDFSGAPLMSPGAQRALAYIVGRNENRRESSSHRPSWSRTQLGHHAGLAPAATANYPPHSRPQTAHAKSRPSISRSESAPRVASAATTSLDLPSSAASAVGGGIYKPSNRANAACSSHAVAGGEKRHSASSNKRLSFTEFTKRLSSTSSSLLIVQTNASTGSSRGSSEIDVHSPSASKANLTARGTNPGVMGASGQSASASNPRSSEGDGRCRWRSKVGVVGHESNLV
ncbi:hypothetical protein HIM_00428 [Hirsutella minnesotensis 3608]|nr:hypothetical protein HIM_00428 [Hirsutella minnesotensis 3608]